ncbi:MAG: cytochrome c oxidase subunit II [Phycisphaerales bacterium]
MNTPLQLLTAPDLPGAIPLASQTGWFTRAWFREASSTFAGGVDGVYYYIFFISAFFFFLLMGLLVYFGIKYRRKPGVAPLPSPSHNLKLELTWSIIPTLLMAVMFVWGMKVYLGMRVSPSDAEEIHVVAMKWSWSWEYDNGAGSLQSENLAAVEAPVFALPLNRPVKLLMESTDVIHSFFIPEFRVKRDLFPNRYTTLWFHPIGQATHRFDEESGTAVPIDADVSKGYFLFCTEYCGDQHSQMLARIAVMADADYRAWKTAQASTEGIPLVELGKKLHTAGGCNACHTVDGGAGTGPTWKNIWGETHRFTNGESAEVNLDYIRQSIIDPGSQVVQGFSNQMPTSAGKFTPREIRAIALYIKSLSDAHREAAIAESEQEMRDQEAARNAAGDAADPAANPTP